MHKEGVNRYKRDAGWRAGHLYVLQFDGNQGRVNSSLVGDRVQLVNLRNRLCISREAHTAPASEQ